MRYHVLAPAILIAVGLAAISHPPHAATPPSKASEEEEPAIDPMGPNSACYVCHMTFVGEEIAKQHLAAKVGCVECHGPSVKHANDENIGATPPDIRYKRAQIDAACAKCHDEHDVSARKVVARFTERKLPADTAPVCTDCHGRHRIDRAAKSN